MAKDKKDKGKGIPLPKKATLPDGTKLSDAESSSETDLSEVDGLVDLTLQADDSQMGGILEQIYPEFLVGSGVPSGNKIFLYDELMARSNFHRDSKVRFYTDGYATVFFAQKKDAEKPKAYVLFGYSLKNFVTELDSINDIKCQSAGKQTKLYDVLKRLEAEYLKVNGRKSMSVLPDNNIGYPRVAFGYSTAYNPEQVLESQIKEIVAQVRGLTETWRDYLNRAISGKGISDSGDKSVRYISGARALKMYWRAYSVRIEPPAEAHHPTAAFEEPVKQYRQEKGVTKPASPPRPLYAKLLGVLSSFRKKPDKKPKQYVHS